MNRLLAFGAMIIFVGTFLFTSCSDMKVKRTTLTVTDPDRHYYPILFGQKIDIKYPIKNTGNELLYIKDIQVSGGCELLNKVDLKFIPSGGEDFIRIRYDGAKSTGYVKNYVTIYANFESGEKQELTFDLNVVPSDLAEKDYEEVFYNFGEITTDDMIDQEIGGGNLRYYVDKK